MKKIAILLILSILIQFLPSEIQPFINQVNANSELVFEVNSYEDFGAIDVTSTICNSVNANCTLRSAIQQAAHIRYNPDDYSEVENIRIDISNVISDNSWELIQQALNNPYQTRPNIFDESVDPIPLEITGNPEQDNYLQLRINQTNHQNPNLPSIILYDNVTLRNIHFIDAIPVIRGSNINVEKNSLGNLNSSSPAGIPGIGIPLRFSLDHNIENVNIINNNIRGDIELKTIDTKVENINITDNHFEHTIHHAVLIDTSTNDTQNLSENIFINDNFINNSVSAGAEFYLQYALITIAGPSNINISNNIINDTRNTGSTKGILLNNPMDGIPMTNINIHNNEISRSFPGGVGIQIGERGDSVNSQPEVPFTETNNIAWNTASSSHVSFTSIHNNNINNYYTGIANLRGFRTEITQDNDIDNISTTSQGVPIFIDPLYTWQTLIEGVVYKIQDNREFDTEHLLTPILVNEEYEKRFYQDNINDQDLNQKMPIIQSVVATSTIPTDLLITFNFPNEVGEYIFTVYQKSVDPENSQNLIIKPIYSENYNFVEPVSNPMQIIINDLSIEDANHKYALKATKVSSASIPVNNSSEIGCFVTPNEDNVQCPSLFDDTPEPTNTENIISSDQINITILNNDQISLGLTEDLKDEFNHPSTQIRFFKGAYNQEPQFYDFNSQTFETCSEFNEDQGFDIAFIISCTDNPHTFSNNIEPEITDTEFNFLDRNSNNKVKHGFVIFNIDLLTYKVGYMEISSTYLRLTNATYDQSVTLEEFDINGLNYIQVSDLVKSDNHIPNETIEVTLIVNDVPLETFQITEDGDTGFFNGIIDTTSYNLQLTDEIEIQSVVDSQSNSNVAFSLYNPQAFLAFAPSLTNEIVNDQPRSPYYQSIQENNFEDPYFIMNQVTLEGQNIYRHHQNGISILIQIDNLDELDTTDPNQNIPILSGPALGLSKNFLGPNGFTEQAMMKADININTTEWHRYTFNQNDFTPLDTGSGIDGEIFDNFWTEGKIDDLFLIIPMESGTQTIRFKDILFNYVANHTLSRSYTTTGQESEDPTDPEDPENPTDPSDPEDPAQTTGSITQTTISSGSKPCRINPELCDEEELKARGIIDPADSKTEKEYSRKSSDELTYQQLVKLMLDLGIVTKEPYKYANRCELAVMLTRIHQFNTQDNIERIFADTPEWCTNQATELHNREITFGLSNNFYGANQLVTENEVATILKRLKGIHLPEYSFTYNFNRFSPIQDWAMSSASWFRENSLFKLTNQVSVFQKHKYIKKVDAAILFWKNK